MTVDLAVICCVWGEYHKYEQRWYEAVMECDPAPREIIVSSDAPITIPVKTIISENTGVNFQTARLNEAIAAAESEWIVAMGIDDWLMPDVFNGLPKEGVDVWQIGYVVRNQTIPDHIPPEMSAVELRTIDYNPTTAPSPFRKELWEKVGGFRDIAFSDWALFRDMAWADARFKSSGKYGYWYDWHHPTSLSGKHQPDLLRHLDDGRTMDYRRADQP